jgi:hypothetical protein
LGSQGREVAQRAVGQREGAGMATVAVMVLADAVERDVRAELDPPVATGREHCRQKRVDAIDQVPIGVDTDLPQPPICRQHAGDERGEVRVSERLSTAEVHRLDVLTEKRIAERLVEQRAACVVLRGLGQPPDSTTAAFAVAGHRHRKDHDLRRTGHAVHPFAMDGSVSGFGSAQARDLRA